MDTAARQLVKKLLEEGKRNDDVRRALISEGFSTEGYEGVYKAVKDELGITDPPPKALVSVPNPIPPKHTEDAIQSSQSSSWLNILKLLTGFLVLVFAVLLLSGIGPRMWQSVFGGFSVAESTQSPADITRESQMRTLQLAAEAYRAKLLDYGGVCNSLGMDKEVYSCVEHTETYAIETILSDGSYFCIDSSGFAGVRSSSHGGSSTCPQ